MNQNPGRDWRSILLALGGIGMALFLFGVALVMLVFDIVDVFTGSLGVKASLLETILVASALIFMGCLLLPGSYYSIQRWRGKVVGLARPKPLRVWQGALVILSWLAASGLAQLFFNRPILNWLTPPLFLVSIALPAFFLVRLAIGGLNLGSRQRLWGIFGTGILLGPIPATLIEGLLAVMALMGLAVYLAVHPELIATFQNIASQLQNAASLDEILGVVGPFLLNPITILLGLLFFSVLTPIIEEVAKSLSVWTIFDRLESPAQGFALGALSGAGFGLLESLFASASPDSSWAATLIVRGGSTMMHILTASLTGWGIASYHSNKRLVHVVGMYAVAMFLHSSWNACVIFITYGGLLAASGPQSLNTLGMVLVVFGAAILLTMALSIPLVVGIANWKLRPAMALSASPLPFPIPAQEKIEGDNSHNSEIN